MIFIDFVVLARYLLFLYRQNLKRATRKDPLSMKQNNLKSILGEKVCPQ